MKTPMKPPMTAESSRALKSSPVGMTRPTLWLAAAPSLSPPFWTMVNTSLMAKTPIRTGSSCRPLMRRTFPKVKRSIPATASTPTVEMRRPTKPAMSPLTVSLPVLAIMDRPKMLRAKKSGEVNERATFASWGAMSARQIALTSPPMKELTAEIPRARPASPFRVMG